MPLLKFVNFFRSRAKPMFQTLIEDGSKKYFSAFFSEWVSGREFINRKDRKGVAMIARYKSLQSAVSSRRSSSCKSVLCCLLR